MSDTFSRFIRCFHLLCIGFLFLLYLSTSYLAVGRIGSVTRHDTSPSAMPAHCSSLEYISFVHCVQCPFR